MNSPEAKAKYETNLAAWKVKAESAKKSGIAFKERAPNPPDQWLNGNARPGNIYNGVLLPTIGYGIKGAIWYQGESNASRAYEYAQLFPLMIQHWREEWKQGDFPFYWVQLADFMAEKSDALQATASSWAELRESQTKTQTAIKNGGQAVIVDLGESNDIHPKNKRDVAERLARIALAKDYGLKLPFRSPEWKSATIEGSKAIVTLDTFGSSLRTVDVSEVQGFVVCGEDKKWVWAMAKIIGKDQIEVTAPSVSKPIAVRYAWSDNPVCNLFSIEGLPVTPFRSDEFEMLTKPK
jgi:sialate O-acetylesterase